MTSDFFILLLMYQNAIMKQCCFYQWILPPRCIISPLALQRFPIKDEQPACPLSSAPDISQGTPLIPQLQWMREALPGVRGAVKTQFWLRVALPPGKILRIHKIFLGSRAMTDKPHILHGMMQWGALKGISLEIFFLSQSPQKLLRRWKKTGNRNLPVLCNACI